MHSSAVNTIAVQERARVDGSIFIASAVDALLERACPASWLLPPAVRIR
jgi:hypothetical protein